MLKDAIMAIVDRFNWDTPDVKKSAVNRMLSALDKTGSASSRLSMVSASLSALQTNAKLDEDGEDYSSLDLIKEFLNYASLVAVDNKAEATEKKPRDKYVDTDSPEGIAILAGLTGKKNKPKPNRGNVGTIAHTQFTPEQIAQIVLTLGSLGASK